MIIIIAVGKILSPLSFSGVSRKTLFCFPLSPVGTGVSGRYYCMYQYILLDYELAVWHCVLLA